MQLDLSYLAPGTAKAEKTIKTVAKYASLNETNETDFVFKSPRFKVSRPMSRSYYARLVKQWARSIDKNPDEYGPLSLRRFKPLEYFNRTDDLIGTMRLLGHHHPEQTIRFLGVDRQKALNKARLVEL